MNQKSVKPWNVTYADGSGNSFRFQRKSSGLATFEYSPVTPRESSSGTYSGGPPQQGQLDEKLADELWRWVLRLEAETSLHASSRRKGTGAFDLKTTDGQRSFLFEDCPELAKFNEFLKREISPTANLYP